MSSSHSGIDHQLVSTEPRDTLGSIINVVGTEGLQEWVYVFNDETSSAFAVGDIIVRDPSVNDEVVHGGLIAASGTVFAHTAVIGVAQHAIAAGSYGYVLKRGQGLVKNGTGDIAADTAITPGGDRAGAAISMAAGNEHGQIGLALEAEATDNVTFDAFINVP